jgi:hypothetical protein
MWIALFSTTIAFAVAASVAAVMMETYGEKAHS